MNITNTEDNTLLGRYNASAENSTVKIQAPLPDSVINKCVTLKFLATAVSEQYGESEANEAFAELYKSKLLIRVKLVTTTVRAISCTCVEFIFSFTTSLHETS